MHHPLACLRPGIGRATHRGSSRGTRPRGSQGDEMAKRSPVPAWQRALVVLTGTVVGVVVVACLYWAQVIFIPLALAVFFTFLLSPLVMALQRRRLPRAMAVVVVVAAAVLILGG